MFKLLALYFHDTRGVTAIEYGVIAAAMGIALVTVMPKLVSQVMVQFSSIGSHLASGQ